MFSCESFKVFFRKYTLQNTSGGLPSCFVSLSKNFGWNVFLNESSLFQEQYLQSQSLIVPLSQLLSADSYLKMPKFLQCHGQPRAPQKRSAPTVNDHPTIVDIPKIVWKRSMYPIFFSCHCFNCFLCLIVMLDTLYAKKYFASAFWLPIPWENT